MSGQNACVVSGGNLGPTRGSDAAGLETSKLQIWQGGREWLARMLAWLVAGRETSKLQIWQAGMEWLARMLAWLLVETLALLEDLMLQVWRPRSCRSGRPAECGWPEC